MKRLFGCHGDIPQESVEKILLNLPVKSLVRFRSVCKSWNSLITHTHFIGDHLQSNINKSNKSFSSPSPSSSSSLLLGWTLQEQSIEYIFRNDDNSHPVYNYDNDEYVDKDDDPDLDQKQRLSLLTIGGGAGGTTSTTAAVEEVYLPLRPKVLGDGNGFLMSLFGSHCNGILCLLDYSPFFVQRVVFYNPALKEHKFLQTSKSIPYYLYSGFGFGYDSSSNDYKFVRILEDHERSWVTKAEVYTLGTDRWREFKVDVRNTLDRRTGVYFNGFYFWIIYLENNMLSFDMSEDKFSIIPMPPQDPEWTSPQRLAVWNELLVCFRDSLANKWFSNSFEMWVMDGGIGVWTKYLTIGPLVCIHSPLAFSKKDELLMEGRDGQVVSYNLCSKELSKLLLPGAVLPQTTYATQYVESLVSVMSKKKDLMSQKRDPTARKSDKEIMLDVVTSSDVFDLVEGTEAGQASLYMLQYYGDDEDVN